MGRSTDSIDVYLEVGKKRTFAGAIQWPGWSRIGRDEAAALEALAGTAPRYARVLGAAQIAFRAPTDASAFTVVERLEGNGTTDFGAPDVAPSSDAGPIDQAELRRLGMLLQAYWQAFGAAVRAAAGKELRKGPRGGGRDLEKIVEHVLGAEAAYLSRLAWKPERRAADNLRAELRNSHRAVLDALAAAARGELPERGPRGGVTWAPRYFARRVGWHVLDHLWEIEDRLV